MGSHRNFERVTSAGIAPGVGSTGDAFEYAVLKSAPGGGLEGLREVRRSLTSSMPNTLVNWQSFSMHLGISHAAAADVLPSDRYARSSLA